MGDHSTVDRQPLLLRVADSRPAPMLHLTVRVSASLIPPQRAGVNPIVFGILDAGVGGYQATRLRRRGWGLLADSSARGYARSVWVVAVYEWGLRGSQVCWRGRAEAASLPTPVTTGARWLHRPVGALPPMVLGILGTPTVVWHQIETDGASLRNLLGHHPAAPPWETLPLKQPGDRGISASWMLVHPG